MSERGSDDGAEAKFILIDEEDGLEVALQALAGCSILAVDAEGPCASRQQQQQQSLSCTHRRTRAGTDLSRHGRLCTLQVGMPRSQEREEDVYVIDICTLGKKVRSTARTAAVVAILQASKLHVARCSSRPVAAQYYTQQLSPNPSPRPLDADP